MRLNQQPTLRLRGRYFSPQSLWRELSSALGANIQDADGFFAVLTDPFEAIGNLTVQWRLPHSPLTSPESEALLALLEAAAVRDDLTLEFPKPPRWLSTSSNLGRLL